MWGRRHRPREPWEKWARPAVALVFISVYRLAACSSEEPTTDPAPPQPPAWVQEER